MMLINKSYLKSAIFASVLAIVTVTNFSCKKKSSSDKYDFSSTDSTASEEDNQLKSTKVNLSTIDGLPVIPNMVFIEGGKSIIPLYEGDYFTNNHLDRTIEVESFLLDETEVANIHWLEYVYYLKRDSTIDYYNAALPDTNVWRSELAFNDPIAEQYFRYQGFRFYPVVGVNWLQVNDYCEWRTLMVNHYLLEKSGVDFDDSLEAHDNNEVLIPRFRLPSEDEWEHAAQAIVSPQFQDAGSSYRRIYPWDGHTLRNPFGKNNMGTFMANFKRGRGDYGGLGKRMNDGAFYTDNIYGYPPNDFGLYNMAGNVNEWVYDLYRPKGYTFVDILNPDRLSQEKNKTQEELDPYHIDGNFQTLYGTHMRVYKGGSWDDVGYWLMPGNRRFIEEDSSTCTIGFRCAMKLYSDQALERYNKENAPQSKEEEK